MTKGKSYEFSSFCIGGGPKMMNLEKVPFSA
jgi:hypothetical protein